MPTAPNGSSCLSSVRWAGQPPPPSNRKGFCFFVRRSMRGGSRKEGRLPGLVAGGSIYLLDRGRTARDHAFPTEQRILRAHLEGRTSALTRHGDEIPNRARPTPHRIAQPSIVKISRATAWTDYRKTRTEQRPKGGGATRWEPVRMRTHPREEPGDTAMRVNSVHARKDTARTAASDRLVQALSPRQSVQVNSLCTESTTLE